MDLHAEIMNLKFSAPADVAWTVAEQQAAKIGHRDARHAAAELALKCNALVDTLRDIATRDQVELALDPQWSARIARIALTEFGDA